MTILSTKDLPTLSTAKAMRILGGKVGSLFFLSYRPLPNMREKVKSLNLLLPYLIVVEPPGYVGVQVVVYGGLDMPVVMHGEDNKGVGGEVTSILIITQRYSTSGINLLRPRKPWYLAKGER